MGSANSDAAEDAGRRESESLFKNKMKSKWLDDVIETTGLDYDEVVEHIERERKMIDNMETGFLNSLELAIHEKAYAPIQDVYGRGCATWSISDSSERMSQVNNFLESSEQLLELHQKAARAISDGTVSPGSYAHLEKDREKDQERTRQLLAVGKRVYERELDGIDQQAQAKDCLGVDRDVVAQANQVFGGRKSVGCDHDADRALKYMQKGIRKMTKGLEYGA